MNIHSATKHLGGKRSKELDMGKHITKSVKRSSKLQDFRGKMIDEVRGDKNNFPPIGMRNIGSEHHSSCHLKQVSIFSLNHSILSRGVWT